MRIAYHAVLYLLIIVFPYKAFATPIAPLTPHLQAAAIASGFDHSITLSNEELATMRGGFAYGPVGIDMDFISQISVHNPTAGVNFVTEVAFSTVQGPNDLAQQIMGSLQPVIIQNELPGTLIQLNQMLDITVTGALNNIQFNHMTDAVQNTTVMSLY